MSEIPPPVYKPLNYQRGKEAILAAHAPQQTQQSETKTPELPPLPSPVYISRNYVRGKEAILAARAPRQQRPETKTSTPTVAELQERLTTLGAEPDESPTPSTTSTTNK